MQKFLLGFLKRFHLGLLHELLPEFLLCGTSGNPTEFFSQSLLILPFGMSSDFFFLDFQKEFLENGIFPDSKRRTCEKLDEPPTEFLTMLP